MLLTPSSLNCSMSKHSFDFISKFFTKKPSLYIENFRSLNNHNHFNNVLSA